MTEDDRDPSAIRSLAISPADAVDAYVYSRANPGEAVLRVTPPFHGRMRARLHVYHVDDTELTGAVHVSPDDAIADDVVAEYPRIETPADDDSERLRERHAEAIEAWRARAREAIAETVSIETESGPRTVDLKQIG